MFDEVHGSLEPKSQIFKMKRKQKVRVWHLKRHAAIELSSFFGGTLFPGNALREMSTSALKL